MSRSRSRYCKGNDFTDAQVGPEGGGGQRLEVVGHGGDEGGDLGEVDQGPLGGGGLSGAGDAAGVAVQGVVGDGGVEYRAEHGLGLPGGGGAGGFDG